MHLALLGLPGAGKTTLGRALAAHFALPFVDLDDEIAALASQPVPAIFAAHGEAHFRTLEAAALRQVLARPAPLVLATGGGTPCFHGNLAELQARSLTLWLDVPAATIAARLGAEAAQRPLLAGAPDLAGQLAETLARRRWFYAQARLRCPVPACTPQAVAAQLAATGWPPAEPA